MELGRNTIRPMKRSVVGLLFGTLTLLPVGNPLAEQNPFIALFAEQDIPATVLRAQRLILVNERFEEALALLEEAESELASLPKDRAHRASARISVLRIVSYQALKEKAKAEAEYQRLRKNHPDVAKEIDRLRAGPKLEPVQGSPFYVDPPKGPYRGRVIDAETKAPIPGAVVLAYWDYEVPTWIHLTTKFYEAREVLTDSNGEFFMDVADIEGLAPPRTRAPEFVIFKPGYGYYPRYQLTPKTNLISAFRGKGSVVELVRWKTKKERTNAFLSPPARVPDTKMPELLKALNEEGRQLGLKGRYEIPGDKP